MQADRTSRPQAPYTPPRGDQKLDQWLRRSLADAHDKVLSENVPDSWLALIDNKLPRA